MNGCDTSSMIWRAWGAGLGPSATVRRQGPGGVEDSLWSQSHSAFSSSVAWASHIPSLSLSFLIHIMGIISTSFTDEVYL